MRTGAVFMSLFANNYKYPADIDFIRYHINRNNGGKKFQIFSHLSVQLNRLKTNSLETNEIIHVKNAGNQNNNKKTHWAIQKQ